MALNFRFLFANIFILVLLFQCSSSAPIELMYTAFISEMNKNKCTTPDQIKAPLNSTSDNLSSYLDLCQNPETFEHSKEARFLCQEIFKNLKSILCPPISVKIVANLSNFTLSKNICEDIKSVKNDVPESQALLKRLTDDITCQLMCDGIYENACQVLLWSHQLQQFKVENPVKEVKENSLQGRIEADADNTKAEDPHKATQALQKSTVTEQQTRIKDSTKQESSNNLVSTLDKSTTTVKQQQSQIPEQQIDPENPPTPVKDPNSNNLPLNQNDLAKNNSSLNAIQLQRDEINNNELPEQDNQNSDPGIPEQENPHDQEEPTINEPAHEASALPPQNPDKPPASNELPDLPNNEPAPEQPVEVEPLPPKLQEPVATAQDGAEPHDDQEIGEEDRATRPESKVLLPVIKPNDILPKTVIKNSDTTKGQTADGTTKISTTKVDAKVIPEEKTEEQKSSELPSSLPSSKASSVAMVTTKDAPKSTVALEKLEGEDDVHENPEDREPDPYTDLENTGGESDDDYARQEYDGAFEPSKIKPIPERPNEMEVSKLDVLRPREPTFNNDFSPRNSYNRQSVEGLPVFPDQEDGHFFFYFLSIVLILMGGYLLFHNKQKIIALIVEGRHERRRRSHGAGYKKLETK